ncbi:MAG: hypothetical protein ACK57K_11980 [Chryseotalea sp.]|jgi:hypothetical protein|nr:META domain-containing protein [Flammeovirgaceae bacterium]MCZ8023805.1 hypothetical protein [Cytophagales bacterium]
MKSVLFVSILLSTCILIACGLMPPRRQYIRETKQQIIPAQLLNTNWTLELWDGKTPDSNVTMDFYSKGRFTFKWNELDFVGDNLWYIVKDSSITFHTRPIEKIVWTKEKYKLEPNNFALDLMGIKNYKIENGKLILTSTNKILVFKKS